MSEHAAGQSDIPLPPQPGRRTFLHRVWLCTTVVTGVVAAVAVLIPFIRYALGALRAQQEDLPWVRLGAVSDFPEGETRVVPFLNTMRQPWDGEIAGTEAFVRYEGLDPERRPRFLVLAVNCAHLGCPVSWFAQSGLFMCPCHGGVYYASGERASGPPPRGLYQYVWEVRDDALWVRAPHYPTLQDTLRDSV